MPDPRAVLGALHTMTERKGSDLALACCEWPTSAPIDNSVKRPFDNGMLPILVDPARLDDRGGFGLEVTVHLAHVPATTPKPGCERATRREDSEGTHCRSGREESLSSPGAVFDQIAALAEGSGIDAAELRA